MSGRNWRVLLVVVIAALYAWVGLSAAGLDRLLGLTGALLIVAAVGVANRSRPGRGMRRPASQSRVRATISTRSTVRWA
jgi:hypothetical protein